MGSSVSVVVTENVIPNIEEQALSTYTKAPRLWLRYVDETFTAVHEDDIDVFHEHLNRPNPGTQLSWCGLKCVSFSRVLVVQETILLIKYLGDMTI